ncbi:MAG: DUF1844 domain-containing protein [Verrucomicrobiae bacterium]|nr:DUF1844 domain-containing protein [Verrucomicrobiae bacterium]
MSDHAKPQADAPRRESGYFARLIELLAQNAVMMLGGMADRQGRQMPPDLRGAEMVIEMMTVLQKRTKGNLAKEEERMLSGTLYQLQTAFAEVASKSGEFEKARKASEAAEAADSVAGADAGQGFGLEEDFDNEEGAPTPPPPAEAARPGGPAPVGTRPQGIQSSAPEPRESKVKFTKKYG